MQEDAHLVEQTLVGDEQSFHSLIMKYYPSINALILSKIKNHEDAKDITQDVFFEAYSGLRTLRRPDQFYHWIRQIAINHCKNWFRKGDSFDQLHENMISETPSAEEMLILRETLVKVMKAIDELPESESRLLRERYLDDASYDELKARHGLSYNALAMRLFRAKQHAREKIAKMLSCVLLYPFKGVMEAMKIGVKTKIISIGIVGILVLGGTGIVVWHIHNTNSTEQSTPINSINQVMSKPESLVSQSPIKKTVLGDVTHKLVNESKYLPDKNIKEKEVNEIATNSKESNTNTIVEGKTPAEILKKYNAIMSSPEFMAEARNILVSGRIEIGVDEKKIEELKNKEKELENNLQTASEDKRSDIENELAKTKDEIWETRVNIQKQQILNDDAYQKLKLKYITVEEIRIAQQELRKTRPQLPSGSEDDNTEEGKLNSMAWDEALKRLKADGWEPNPLRSYNDH
ncbi:MAG: sigma-70 family RNA polymerase sigma factor [Candidatus Poribacteria bacterium]|mgnify:CR=1 FL=1